MRVVAGTSDEVAPRPGVFCQDDGAKLCGESVVCGVSVDGVVVMVMPFVCAPVAKRLMGIIQWPLGAFFIWKCREPGLGLIWTPPCPRNQISPVLRLMRASLRSRLCMPMSPGPSVPSIHGALYVSSWKLPCVSCKPHVNSTSYSADCDP